MADNKSKKERLKEIKELIQVLEMEKDNIINTCEHEIIKSGSSAKCDICGKYGGWYCPESLNHMCDYEQEDGSYDEDCCRYCGEPEERK